MRYLTLVILCCALQYSSSVSSENGPEQLDLILNNFESGKGFTETDFEEQDVYTTDEHGDVYEKTTTHKTFERDGNKSEKLNSNENKLVRTITIYEDESGHDVITEEEVLIKKVPSKHTGAHLPGSQGPKRPIAYGPVSSISATESESAATAQYERESAVSVQSTLPAGSLIVIEEGPQGISGPGAGTTGPTTKVPKELGKYGPGSSGPQGFGKGSGPIYVVEEGPRGPAGPRNGPGERGPIRPESRGPQRAGPEGSVVIIENGPSGPGAGPYGPGLRGPGGYGPYGPNVDISTTEKETAASQQYDRESSTSVRPGKPSGSVVIVEESPLGPAGPRGGPGGRGPLRPESRIPQGSGPEGPVVIIKNGPSGPGAGPYRPGSRGPGKYGPYGPNAEISATERESAASQQYDRESSTSVRPGKPSGSVVIVEKGPLGPAGPRGGPGGRGPLRPESRVPQGAGPEGPVVIIENGPSGPGAGPYGPGSSGPGGYGPYGPNGEISATERESAASQQYDRESSTSVRPGKPSGSVVIVEEGPLGPAGPRGGPGGRGPLRPESRGPQGAGPGGPVVIIENGPSGPGAGPYGPRSRGPGGYGPYGPNTEISATERESAASQQYDRESSTSVRPGKPSGSVVIVEEGPLGPAGPRGGPGSRGPGGYGPYGPNVDISTTERESAASQQYDRESSTSVRPGKPSGSVVIVEEGPLGPAGPRGGPGGRGPLRPESRGPQGAGPYGPGSRGPGGYGPFGPNAEISATERESAASQQYDRESSTSVRPGKPSGSVVIVEEGPVGPAGPRGGPGSRGPGDYGPYGPNVDISTTERESAASQQYDRESSTSLRPGKPPGSVVIVEESPLGPAGPRGGPGGRGPLRPESRGPQGAGPEGPVVIIENGPSGPGAGPYGPGARGPGGYGPYGPNAEISATERESAASQQYDRESSTSVRPGKPSGSVVIVEEGPLGPAGPRGGPGGRGSLRPESRGPQGAGPEGPVVIIENGPSGPGAGPYGPGSRGPGGYGPYGPNAEISTTEKESAASQQYDRESSTSVRPGKPPGSVVIVEESPLGPAGPRGGPGGRGPLRPESRGPQGAGPEGPVVIIENGPSGPGAGPYGPGARGPGGYGPYGPNAEISATERESAASQQYDRESSTSVRPGKPSGSVVIVEEGPLGPAGPRGGPGGRGSLRPESRGPQGAGPEGPVVIIENGPSGPGAGPYGPGSRGPGGYGPYGPNAEISATERESAASQQYDRESSTSVRPGKPSGSVVIVEEGPLGPAGPRGGPGGRGPLRPESRGPQGAGPESPVVIIENGPRGPGGYGPYGPNAEISATERESAASQQYERDSSTSIRPGKPSGSVVIVEEGPLGPAGPSGGPGGRGPLRPESRGPQGAGPEGPVVIIENGPSGPGAGPYRPGSRGPGKYGPYGPNAEISATERESAASQQYDRESSTSVRPGKPSGSVVIVEEGPLGPAGPRGGPGGRGPLRPESRGPQGAGPEGPVVIIENGPSGPGAGPYGPGSRGPGGYGPYGPNAEISATERESAASQQYDRESSTSVRSGKPSGSVVIVEEGPLGPAGPRGGPGSRGPGGYGPYGPNVDISTTERESAASQQYDRESSTSVRPGKPSGSVVIVEEGSLGPAGPRGGPGGRGPLRPESRGPQGAGPYGPGSRGPGGYGPFGPNAEISATERESAASQQYDRESSTSVRQGKPSGSVVIVEEGPVGPAGPRGGPGSRGPGDYGPYGPNVDISTTERESAASQQYDRESSTSVRPGKSPGSVVIVEESPLGPAGPRGGPGGRGPLRPESRGPQGAGPEGAVVIIENGPSGPGAGPYGPGARGSGGYGPYGPNAEISATERESAASQQYDRESSTSVRPGKPSGSVVIVEEGPLGPAGPRGGPGGPNAEISATERESAASQQYDRESSTSVRPGKPPGSVVIVEEGPLGPAGPRGGPGGRGPLRPESRGPQGAGPEGPVVIIENGPSGPGAGPYRPGSRGPGRYGPYGPNAEISATERESAASQQYDRESSTSVRPGKPSGSVVIVEEGPLGPAGPRGGPGGRGPLRPESRGPQGAGPEGPVVIIENGPSGPGAGPYGLGSHGPGGYGPYGPNAEISATERESAASQQYDRESSTSVRPGKPSGSAVIVEEGPLGPAGPRSGPGGRGPLRPESRGPQGAGPEGPVVIIENGPSGPGAGPYGPGYGYGPFGPNAEISATEKESAASQQYDRESSTSVRPGKPLGSVVIVEEGPLGPAGPRGGPGSRGPGGYGPYRPNVDISTTERESAASQQYDRESSTSVRPEKPSGSVVIVEEGPHGPAGPRGGPGGRGPLRPESRGPQGAGPEGPVVIIENGPSGPGAGPYGPGSRGPGGYGPYGTNAEISATERESAASQQYDRESSTSVRPGKPSGSVIIVEEGPLGPAGPRGGPGGRGSLRRESRGPQGAGPEGPVVIIENGPSGPGAGPYGPGSRGPGGYGPYGPNADISATERESAASQQYDRESSTSVRPGKPSGTVVIVEEGPLGPAGPRGGPGGRGPLRPESRGPQGAGPESPVVIIENGPRGPGGYGPYGPNAEISATERESAASQQYDRESSTSVRPEKPSGSVVIVEEGPHGPAGPRGGPGGRGPLRPESRGPQGAGPEGPVVIIENGPSGPGAGPYGPGSRGPGGYGPYGTNAEISATERESAASQQYDRESSTSVRPGKPSGSVIIVEEGPLGPAGPRGGPGGRGSLRRESRGPQGAGPEGPVVIIENGPSGPGAGPYGPGSRGPGGYGPYGPNAEISATERESAASQQYDRESSTSVRPGKPSGTVVIVEEGPLGPAGPRGGPGGRGPLRPESRGPQGAGPESPVVIIENGPRGPGGYGPYGPNAEISATERESAASQQYERESSTSVRPGKPSGSVVIVEEGPLGPAGPRGGPGGRGPLRPESRGPQGAGPEGPVVIIENGPRGPGGYGPYGPNSEISATERESAASQQYDRESSTSVRPGKPSGSIVIVEEGPLGPAGPRGGPGSRGPGGYGPYGPNVDISTTERESAASQQYDRESSTSVRPGKPSGSVVIVEEGPLGPAGPRGGPGGRGPLRPESRGPQGAGPEGPVVIIENGPSGPGAGPYGPGSRGTGGYGPYGPNAEISTTESESAASQQYDRESSTSVRPGKPSGSVVIVEEGPLGPAGPGAGPYGPGSRGPGGYGPYGPNAAISATERESAASQQYDRESSTSVRPGKPSGSVVIVEEGPLGPAGPRDGPGGRRPLRPESRGPQGAGPEGPVVIIENGPSGPGAGPYGPGSSGPGGYGPYGPNSEISATERESAASQQYDRESSTSVRPGKPSGSVVIVEESPLGPAGPRGGPGSRGPGGYGPYGPNVDISTTERESAASQQYDRESSTSVRPGKPSGSVVIVEEGPLGPAGPRGGPGSRGPGGYGPYGPNFDISTTERESAASQQYDRESSTSVRPGKPSGSVVIVEEGPLGPAGPRGGPGSRGPGGYGPYGPNVDISTTERESAASQLYDRESSTSVRPGKPSGSVVIVEEGPLGPAGPRGGPGGRGPLRPESRGPQGAGPEGPVVIIENGPSGPGAGPYGPGAHGLGGYGPYGPNAEISATERESAASQQYDRESSTSVQPGKPSGSVVIVEEGPLGPAGPRGGPGGRGPLRPESRGPQGAGPEGPVVIIENGPSGPGAGPYGPVARGPGGYGPYGPNAEISATERESTASQQYDRESSTSVRPGKPSGSVVIVEEGPLGPAGPGAEPYGSGSRGPGGYGPYGPNAEISATERESAASQQYDRESSTSVRPGKPSGSVVIVEEGPLGPAGPRGGPGGPNAEISATERESAASQQYDRESSTSVRPGKPSGSVVVVEEGPRGPAGPRDVRGGRGSLRPESRGPQGAGPEGPVVIIENGPGGPGAGPYGPSSRIPEGYTPHVTNAEISLTERESAASQQYESDSSTSVGSLRPDERVSDSYIFTGQRGQGIDSNYYRRAGRRVPCRLTRTQFVIKIGTRRRPCYTC